MRKNYLISLGNFFLNRKENIRPEIKSNIDDDYKRPYLKPGTTRERDVNTIRESRESKP